MPVAELRLSVVGRVVTGGPGEVAGGSLSTTAAALWGWGSVPASQTAAGSAAEAAGRVPINSNNFYL